MRIVAFDHFFDQDLAALREGLESDDVLVTIPYQRLYYLARRTFPAAAFVGVRSAYLPRFERHWIRYRPRARRFADWLAGTHQPDVFVVPTDAIFYLRPVIERFEDHGIPTVVVQKETTISPLVMEEHSAEVAEAVPFMSTLMTVCSERHREFWIRAATDPEKVLVTGQPRFDVYADARHRPGTPDRTNILYLSYEDAAYLPSDLGHSFSGSWADMRRETEEELRAVADSRRARVIVKPHPQQPYQADWLGEHVERALPRSDTRPLITESDIVVGFQTTAIFEAAAAGRPIIYAAWGDTYEQMREMLTAFDEVEGLVNAARSRGELAALLHDRQQLRAPDPNAMRAVTEHLGPIDGGATKRVIDILRGCVDTHAPVVLGVGDLSRAVARQLPRPAIAAASVVASAIPHRRLRAVLAGRRSALAEEGAELRMALRERTASTSRGHHR